MPCPSCQTELPASAISCPNCHSLVHSVRLNELSQLALQLSEDGDIEGAIQHWRDALSLLPLGSKQAKQVAKRIEQLIVNQTNTTKSFSRTQYFKRNGMILGGLGLLIWKFKWAVVLMATKGKFLLLGLSKMTTLFSMLLSLGVYWLAFGWLFALGLVVSIYIHEMGHVHALRKLGIRSSAPMFIPGFGAVVRMEQYPNSVAEDAAVGLSGPVWGLGAALVAWFIYLLGGGEFWGAIAQVGAWINLFNLIPVWQLDGNRGFRALSKRARIAMVVLASLLAWYSSEGMLWLIVIAGVFSLRGEAPAVSTTNAIITYAFLLCALSALTMISLPGLMT